MVLLSNASAHPEAVMVESTHTTLALVAVFGSYRLPGLTVRAPTSPSLTLLEVCIQWTTGFIGLICIPTVFIVAALFHLNIPWLNLDCDELFLFIRLYFSNLSVEFGR
mmetsp:Transcript_34578/g.47919  ORF Transcript_34578/g.47919 Transcript_34578/m.47919 type:complete len:108 (+) Transcript_34578:646-969(+)